jgi:hypothetical protein
MGPKLATASFDQIRVNRINVAGPVRRMNPRVRFHLPQ